MNGRMGACPDDYAVVQAAKYLGVAPWELMEQSVWWMKRALMFMTAEVEAQEIIDAHNGRR
jgi:hypothetical protein